MNRYYLFVFLLLFLSCSIHSDQKSLPSKNPWAIRSVLDGQPRMLTLAMDSNTYLAYDLERCKLTKVWKGGVNFNGAAFNDIKTVQPTSWGKDYKTDYQHPIWLIQRGKRFDSVQVKFKGYDIIQEEFTFRYLLLGENNESILITETLSIEPVNQDRLLISTYKTEYQSQENPLLVSFVDGNVSDELKKGIIVRHERMLPSIPDFPKPVQEVSKNISKFWLDKSGCNTCHKENEFTLGPSYRQIAGKYQDIPENQKKLINKVKNGGAGVWGEVMMIPHPQLEERDIGQMINYILSLTPNKKSVPQKKKKPQPKNQKANKPGFGASLTDIHPAFDLQTIRPKSFKPRVGGMDFMPDGSLLISTWDSLGAIYKLRGMESGDSSKVTIKRIAAGLSEPLGLKVVNGEIFVLQKHELTKLIDLDGDEIIDRYESICNSFGVTADFHEFAYGLEYKDGFFYANLGLAMRLMSHEKNHPDRGKTIRIGLDGSFEHVISGIRQANGIGLGPEDELFISENQGQWVPACKLIQVIDGEFHGCVFHSEIEAEEFPIASPVVWLPHHEIGNSPGQPIFISEGPFKGQMFLGEVTHGGIKRIFLEKINGRYQGAIFRFSQGLEAGINRLAWGPDGALYAGGVGMNGNWGIPGKQFGLQRLVYNGKEIFEMLAIRIKSQGIEIEFTQPIENQLAGDLNNYFIQQWYYKPTAAYGGPKLDLETLTPKSISVSKDHKKVMFGLPQIKEGHVIYINLSEELKSEKGKNLWTGEAWYTVGQKVE